MTFLISEALNYFFLRQNLFKKSVEIQELQNKKFRALIKHAYETVPYFKQKFSSLGLTPANIKTVDDIVKIPPITKSEIQEGSLDNHLSRSYTINQCSARKTSGSTGHPFNLFIDQRGVSISEVLWLRAFLKNGLKIRDKMIFIKNPRSLTRSMSFLQRLGIFPRDEISIFEDPEKQLLKLSAYKPDVIRTWTSCLSVLARRYDRSLNINPRMIFTSAEFLDNYTRKYIEDIFDSKVFDYYSCEEFGLMGWECSKHDGYHINSDSLIIEFLKDDAPAEVGERGEIVVTHLDNFAMPFIRYKLGDIGVLSDDVCTCGLTLPKIKFVEGRNDDFLVALNGDWMSARTVSDVLEYSTDDYKGLIQYRIEQIEKDKIKIMLKVNNLFNSEESFHKVEVEMKKYLGEDMDIDIRLVDDIPADKSGKIRKVISTIKTSL